MEKVYKRETPHTKMEFGTIDFDADCVNEFIERFNEQYRFNGGFVSVGDFKRIIVSPLQDSIIFQNFQSL